MSDRTVIYESQSADDTLRIGRELAQQLKYGDIVALCGELGVGKTVMAKGICAGLGYHGNVSSPSFLRLHSYPHHPPIYHVDFYLIRSEEEIYDLGLDELYGSDNIMIIEWAQRFPHVLPIGCRWIIMEWGAQTETARKITINI